MTDGENDLSRFYLRPNLQGEMTNPIDSLRFTEIATFMRCPMATDLSQVDIGIIGVPYDGGLNCRPGARHGPREVRNQSTMMRKINVSTGARPFDQARIADLGDVRIKNFYDHDKAIAEIEQAFDVIVSAGVLPLSVGGDHSITYPILKALSKHHTEPLALVHVDAHTDTWPEFGGSRFHHGAPFRLATEEGLIDPRKTIQVGIRGGQNFTDGLDFCHDHGMRVVDIEEFEDLGWAAIAKEALEVVGDAPVYLTFDIDGIDPAEAPGTGTPEAGGITMREALRFLRALKGLNFVGGDLVEVSPPLDNSSLTAFNGASLLFEILCLQSQTRSRRG
jgi:guanidinopropionase